MEQFKTISKNAEAEIIEKKSKFIAHVFPVETIEEAEDIIKSIKKKYYDAKHNCFAYAIETNDGGIAVKFNDDGEPQGTAGSPILNVILSKELSNVLVVVTRYFGGILLGTGGLVKAYISATTEAFKKADVINKVWGQNANLQIEYDQFDKLKYFLEKSNIKIIDVKYLENIEIIIEITNEDKQKINKNIEENVIKVLDFRILAQKYIEK